MRQGDGRPSSPSLAGLLRRPGCMGIRVSSWNAASLFGRGPADETGIRRHRRKLRQICALADVSDFICVQELRGVQTDAMEFGHFLPGWKWWISSVGDGSAGGIATLMSPTAQDRWSHAQWEVVVPGRVGVLHIWNYVSDERSDELYLASAPRPWRGWPSRCSCQPVATLHAVSKCAQHSQIGRRDDHR